MINETTARLIADASSGPGPYVARFARARAITPNAITASLVALLRRMHGLELGYVSKALVYDRALNLRPKDAAMFARLVKGGAISAERTATGYVLSCKLF